jgi:hypothetical protein
MNRAATTNRGGDRLVRPTGTRRSAATARELISGNRDAVDATFVGGMADGRDTRIPNRNGTVEKFGRPFLESDDGAFMSTANSPDPDASAFVDYLARAKSIDEQEVSTLVNLPKFCAAVLAYRIGLIPLGYATFFSWADASAALPGLAPARLLDLVRYATWRTRLDASDRRHIAIDYNRTTDAFPGLFKGHSQGKQSHDRFIWEMGEFLASDPRRGNYAHVTSHMREEHEFGEYWLKSSSERVRPLLSDRRFLAALDAFREGALSYGGLLEKVYGDIDHVLFPEIGRHLSGMVIVQMAKAVDRGDITIPAGLRTEYPELYEFYNPEAFGHGR